ncbi:GspH/FimT family protein [Pseudomonas sp. MAFF 302046]|uniref:Type II secretion system protein H n=1 Tax=Pseudomonas morbosilactucae TaxID=2938197 RepID=A0ABT0JJY6_9PSED|nr:GspH/FimT family protein [Pseudomonas morbosilactucae]MCK9816226.1 GspH/FimT family protein [Pseudomonas morbosilactucae]
MKQKGFSLLEILTTLTLLGVLLQFFTGSFSQSILANRSQEAAQQLASGLRNARTAAILHNRTTVIHALEQDWSRGWRIILDLSGKGADDHDNPVLIERQGSEAVGIVGNRPVQDFVRFSALGHPLLPSGAFQAGTLHICARDGETSQHQVVLSRSGRVSLRGNVAEQALCARPA